MVLEGIIGIYHFFLESLICLHTKKSKLVERDCMMMMMKMEMGIE